MTSLNVLLKTKPVSWVNKFVELGGLYCLNDVMKKIEVKPKFAFKKKNDME